MSSLETCYSFDIYFGCNMGNPWEKARFILFFTGIEGFDFFSEGF